MDTVGRVIGATDAKGNTVQYQYNNLNLLTQVTDAQGNNTIFSYDPNGNLLSLTDARNHVTSWTYDNMDRVQTRTDPLLRQESYSYDLNGNLVSSTDRKNQVTSLTYDPLDRLKFVGYKTVVNGGITTYESTTSYTYDAGNRMTQAVDSAGGTITRGYDNFDRLTSETTAQGSITYGYDTASRQTGMTVAGQPAVTYTYDNANRLTQVTQGASSTGFSYDSINRRTALTLPNNVVVSYGYDSNSRLTGLTYQFGANTLGNLTYAYDELGRRTQVGGSFARTGLPGTVTSATYDAANELTNWNGVALSYDQNGNMSSDGSNAFTWNARDQIATLNSVSLKYDAAGRRIQNAAGTSFLYNGANTVQELSGSTVTANLLSGGIDEIFSRTDSSGAFTPLKDVLGSTVALVDSSGNIQTSYTYDPFGNTSVTGTSNTNEFQYTGRENEGNGLYYYRARYYSPTLGRFISQDRLGFRAGINFYAYANGSPTNLRDPMGLESGATLHSQWKMDVCGDETKPCPMKGGPDFRSPDYYSCTGSYGYGALNIQRDRNGQWYWTPTGTAPSGVGGSCTAGFLDPGDGTGGIFLAGRKPDAKEIEEFIKAWGVQVCGGAIVGYCRTYSPGSGWANEFGLMTPGMNGSGGYTLLLGYPKDNSTPVPLYIERQIETPIGSGLVISNTQP